LIPLLFVKEKKTEVKKGFKFLIKLKGLSKEFRSFILVTTFFALGNFSYMFFILKAQISFQKFFGINESIIIVIGLYIIYNIFYAVFSTPIGSLSDKIGRKKIIILGYAIFALTCLGFFLINTSIVYLALFALYGLFYAFIEGTQRALAADLSDKQHGLALNALAILPSSIIAGVIWDYYSPTYTFLYGFIIGICAVFLAIKLIKE